MDTSTKFILIAKRILRELIALSRAVSTGFLGLQKQVEAIGKQQQSKKTADDNPLPPVVSVLTTPAAIKVEAQTHDYKDVWQRIFEILELLGVAAVVAYAVLTYCQLKELRKSVDVAQQTATSAYHQTILAGNSLNAARDQAIAAQQQVAIMQKQFRIEERPWIKATATFPHDISIGEELTVPVAISNVGKTIALDLSLFR